MELIEQEINRFVHYLSKGDEDRKEEIWKEFDRIVLTELKIIHYNTIVALFHCKNFQEIADEYSVKERKKKPLSVDAIRKRSEKAMKTIKDSLMEKYGK